MTTPTDIQDARWRALTLARACGETLSADDTQFLMTYCPQSEVDRVHAAIMSDLACMSTGLDLFDEPSDDDTAVARALRAFVAA